MDEDGVAVRAESGAMRGARGAKDVVRGGGGEDDPAAQNEHAAASAGVGAAEREHAEERGGDAGAGDDPTEQGGRRVGVIEDEAEQARGAEMGRIVAAEEARSAGDDQRQRDAMERDEQRAGVGEGGVAEDEVDEQDRRHDAARIARGEGQGRVAQAGVRRREAAVDEGQGHVEEPEHQEVEIGTAAGVGDDPEHGHGGVCRGERKEKPGYS